MKRLLIGSLALAAVAAPLMTMTSPSASAAQVKMAKPPKLAPLAVTGGNPYPIGTGIPGFTYGHVLIFIDKPALPEPAGHIDSITVTCTPVYKLANTSTDFPTAPIVTTFTNISDSYASATAPAGAKYDIVIPDAATAAALGVTTAPKIRLVTIPYADPANTGTAQYPPLGCALTTGSDPALHPAKFLPGAAMTAAGKAPKLPSSPAIDCNPLTDDGTGPVPGLPLNPVVVPPEIVPGVSTTYHMTVGLTAGGVALGVFCSTDSSYRAKFLTEQTTKISASPKVKAKTHTAIAKKIVLNSPVNSSITLTITRSLLTYKYDPTRLSATSATCIPKAAKTPLLATDPNRIVPGFGVVLGNACFVNQATGTITLISNDSNTVKPGKAIVSAPTDITFTYTPGADTSISLDSAQTYIGIAGTTVLVKLSPAGTYFGIPDSNIGAPAITFSGLL